jgi:predicted amidohydrolase
MSQGFTIACVQLRAGRSVGPNIETASGLIREAAAAGADIIITPEQTGLMELDRKALFAAIRHEDDDPALSAFRALAAELERPVIVGSLAIQVSETQAANRCFVVGPGGDILARYDKIHMFDVDLPGGEIYRESRTYRPGGQAVTVDLLGARFGLTICYDLRFAYLYRALAKAGADILTVPAAFTKTTGEAHWHTLLKARAIETGCFVVAAAQGGRHENGRDTYGHSMVVAPWGEILAEAGTDPCVITARIDLAQVAEARGRVPALTHDRPFEMPAAAGGAEARRAAS